MRWLPATYTGHCMYIELCCSILQATEDQKPQVSQYRELYHQSVQHSEVLQSQVERFRALFTKLQRINILKVSYTYYPSECM